MYLSQNADPEYQNLLGHAYSRINMTEQINKKYRGLLVGTRYHEGSSQTLKNLDILIFKVCKTSDLRLRDQF